MMLRPSCRFKSPNSGGSRISPRREHQLPGGGGGQHTNLPNVPKNCKKLQEFGPGGGGGARDTTA